MWLRHIHDRLAAVTIWAAPMCRRWWPRRSTARPGRVLHVTTSFDLGGTQSQIRHLCTAAATRYEHRATELFPELNYLYRESEALAPARYAIGGRLGRWLGAAVLDRGRRGLALVQIYKLARDFWAERPQVVVGWGHEVCVTTFVAAMLAGVPSIVFCIRTFNPALGWADARMGERLRRAHQRMFPHLAATIVNSTVLRDDHAAWVGVPAERLAVCANGVSPGGLPPAERTAARGRIRRAHGVPDDAVVVANIARFSPEKNQRLLIEVSRLVSAEAGRPPVWWLLCGDGPLLEEVRDLASRHALGNVVFTGRTHDVAAMLAAADLFVMPSAFEGMPNAMMEAMAAGLACVSTTNSGARDVAREGLEALYCEAGDAPAMARLVGRLVDDPGLARQLGAAAAARIRQFDVPSMVRGFESILDDAVRAGSR